MGGTLASAFALLPSAKPPRVVLQTGPPPSVDGLGCMQKALGAQLQRQ